MKKWIFCTKTTYLKILKAKISCSELRSYTMIRHVALLLALITQWITGPCEGLHSSKLNSASRYKIQKTGHKGICFVRFRQILLQQFSVTGRVNCHCRQLSSISQRVKWKICVQKVISYKEQKVSQCSGKQNYVIKSEENSDYL